MRGIFIRVVAAAAVLVLIFLGIGMVLPRNYDVQAEITIEAPPETIFPMINQLPNGEHGRPGTAKKTPDWRFTMV
jgi:hypothetical protein